MYELHTDHLTTELAVERSVLFRGPGYWKRPTAGKLSESPDGHNDLCPFLLVMRSNDWPSILRLTDPEVVTFRAFSLQLVLAWRRGDIPPRLPYC